MCDDVTSTLLASSCCSIVDMKASSASSRSAADAGTAAPPAPEPRASADPELLDRAPSLLGCAASAAIAARSLSVSAASVSTWDGIDSRTWQQEHALTGGAAAPVTCQK